MFCPKCEYEKTKVIGIDNGYACERCRKCPDCGYSWMTIETVKFDQDLKQYAETSAEEAKERKTDHRKQKNLF